MLKAKYEHLLPSKTSDYAAVYKAHLLWESKDHYNKQKDGQKKEININ